LGLFLFDKEYQYGQAPIEGGYKHGQVAQLVMKMMIGIITV